MKDFWEEPKEKKINKKKIIMTIITLIIVAAIAGITITYINNKEARTWIDKNILQKEKTQNNLTSIEIEDENNSNIYAFNKYIGILNKNNFKIYNNAGKEEKELTLEISKPIFNQSNRYLAVAEEKGQKIYLIADKDILWEREIEGNNSRHKLQNSNTTIRQPRKCTIQNIPIINKSSSNINIRRQQIPSNSTSRHIRNNDTIKCKSNVNR